MNILIECIHILIEFILNNSTVSSLITGSITLIVSIITLIKEIDHHDN